MKKIRQKVDGVLLLDKPVGISSNNAIQRVKWLLNAEKVGHTGTLDPEASGLLPVCLGEATKFASYLLDGDKEYLATAQLGVVTDSGDSEGNIVAHNPVMVDLPQINNALAHYTTTYLQIPPMYSALKYQGKPLYEYARAGIEIERPGRQVTIHQLELAEYNPQLQQVVFKARVSKGTYIRTLAEDIGNYLGCGASLVALRRLASNEFQVNDAISLENLAGIIEKQQALPLLNCSVLVQNLAEYHLTAAEYEIIKFGNISPLAKPENFTENTQVAMFAAKMFLGVAEIDVAGQQLRPRRLISGLSGINPWL